MSSTLRIRGKLEGLAASASFSSRDEFLNLWGLLRSNKDFAGAAEQVDRVASALQRAYGIALPTPKDLFQNPDRTLCLCWGEGGACLSVFFHSTTILWRVGGVGEPQAQVHPEVHGVPFALIETLALRARMSSTS